MKIAHLAALALSLSVAGCSTCRTGGAPSASAGGSVHLVNTDAHGVALDGHDPVAFFTVGKPVKGSAAITSRWDGATYRFASAEDKRLFDASPAEYAPAYGGYCGYAASIDRISPIDVSFFQIIDGRLVLQHNQKAWDRWNEDVPGNVVKADRNWPGLVQKHGRGERQLVNVDDRGLALEGHDPVAYFTEHRPVKGDDRFEAHYNGAIYRFASMENRVTFENDPARYAPAFGGFCGYAASIDKVSPVNVHIFQVIDGRLVLQHTPKAYELFNEDAPAALARADRNWPGLVQCKGK